ncbi:hypothetical protein DL766_001430 [Monosporascus sp. MC13-8B]|uniref:Uncharacterized protein n=1 Tax=Monosporascus cannonballus TaxID=155416 RepID=A0ABY0H010_9PEZI|nr:hypothetical protein DL762_008704 [Monosporascus cannonballus]RYP00431.1 hypothetical protein DL763_000783 [Monosporascus cannonballus]RYP37614.1 hypothetical protein DL766_001430 [Monosporascus sp. MC13-8B]
MAHASFYDVFLRLPPSAAFLFLASILRTADCHALPRQTKTVEPHELNVVPWPPLPTDAPISPSELLRRQENTICGYLNFGLIHDILHIFYYDDDDDDLHINEFGDFIHRLAYGGALDRGYTRRANGRHNRGRQVNGREGPGPAPAAPPRTEYTSPMRSHGAAFAPLPGWQEDRQPSPRPYDDPYTQQHHESEPTTYEPQIGVNYITTPLGPPPRRYDPVHVPGVGTGLTPVEEEASTENPTREIDDFSRAYADARIGQAPEDDQQPLTIPEERAGSGSESEHSRSPARGGNRPLWQQNRQRSRNMMWM